MLPSAPLLFCRSAAVVVALALSISTGEAQWRGGGGLHGGGGWQGGGWRGGGWPGGGGWGWRGGGWGGGGGWWPGLALYGVPPEGSSRRISIRSGLFRNEFWWRRGSRCQEIGWQRYSSKPAVGIQQRRYRQTQGQPRPPAPTATPAATTPAPAATAGPATTTPSAALPAATAMPTTSATPLSFAGGNGQCQCHDDGCLTDRTGVVLMGSMAWCPRQTTLSLRHTASRMWSTYVCVLRQTAPVHPRWISLHLIEPGHRAQPENIAISQRSATVTNDLMPRNIHHSFPTLPEQW